MQEDLKSGKLERGGERETRVLPKELRKPTMMPKGVKREKAGIPNDPSDPLPPRRYPHNPQEDDTPESIKRREKELPTTPCGRRACRSPGARAGVFRGGGVRAFVELARQFSLSTARPRPRCSTRSFHTLMSTTIPNKHVRRQVVPRRRRNGLRRARGRTRRTRW